MSENEQSGFEAITVDHLSFVHTEVSVLEKWAASYCVKLLQLHEVQSPRVVHVGAGFGLDMRVAHQLGVEYQIGFEKNESCITFAHWLERAAQKIILKVLHGDPVIANLYSPELIEKVVRNFCTERAMHSLLLDIRQCNLRDPESANTEVLKLNGLGFNAMIGNIMLHWLVQDGNPLEAVLDNLSLFLEPGAKAVFSVPFHLTELVDEEEDEAFRNRSLHDTMFYRSFTSHLLGFMKGDFDTVNYADFRKVPPSLLIKESEARKGSPTMEYLGWDIKRSPHGAKIDEVMAGVGTFEASIRTGAKPNEVAHYVRMALNQAINTMGTNESPASYVCFYMFQRR